MVFSHDGLHDSLTRVAAPPFLYESLKREISLAERSNRPLTAISIILKSDQPIYDYPLVAFADIALRSIRLEDHVARMGKDNFIFLINGESDLADQLTARILAQWTIDGVPGISLHYGWILHQSGESSLEFLNRLDMQELRYKEF